MNSSLPPEKINQIKQIIHQRYNEIDIQSQIRDIISDKLSSDTNRPSQDMIVQEIRKKGIIDSLMTGMKFENQLHQARANQSLNNAAKPVSPANNSSAKTQEYAIPLNKATLDTNKRQLYLQLLNGKAFLEYLTVDSSLDAGDEFTMPGQAQTAFFNIYVHFRGQRFKTRPFSCSCEPRINEGFLLELNKSSENNNQSGQLMADSAALLSITDPIHLVMLRTDLNGDTHLVSSHFMEWRSILTFPGSKQTVSIELMGTGAESRIPAGILNVCVQLVPHLEESLREDIFGAQLGLEHSKNTERERLFLVYAKQWWKEYLEIRDDHKNRLVKIFAQDENGTNRLVCSYVKPMRTGRLIDSPRQAARFVSLIGYSRSAPSFGISEKQEQWMHLHTFLVRNSGDSENHSILLCNLLLGFGLDAYVCVGTKGKGVPHTWVVTISYDYEEIIFWESLTGNRYVHVYLNPDDPPLQKSIVIRHPYKTVGCVFNHKNFYANVQPIQSVDTCCFSLRDQARWKSMSEDAIQTVCQPSFVSTIPYVPTLCQNPLDPTLLSNDLERQLKSIITLHRKDIGLNTFWDDHLSYVLSPALSSYEMERITGMSIGNEEFDQAVKLAIPDGHSFKAFPIQFVHRNARKVFASCLKSSVCEEIVTCRGDQVKLALRVKVFTYPENTIATWIMLACRYKIIV